MLFVRGTVEYEADLVGLGLTETNIPGVRPPVTSVQFSNKDGRQFRATVNLGPVESEEAAVAAADAEAHRAWGAVLLYFPENISRASQLKRGAVNLERPPTPGTIYAQAVSAIAFMGEAFAFVTPGQESMVAYAEVAADPAWRGPPNVALEMYSRALREADHVAQYLALYDAASMATEIHLNLAEAPQQREIDRALRSIDKSIPLLWWPAPPSSAPSPSPPPRARKPRQETPFTRARNQVAHPRERGVTWEQATADVSGKLPAFRKLVARLVRASLR